MLPGAGQIRNARRRDLHGPLGGPPGGGLQVGREHRQGGRTASEGSCLGLLGVGPRVKPNQRDVLEVGCPGSEKIFLGVRLEIKLGPGTLPKVPDENSRRHRPQSFTRGPHLLSELYTKPGNYFESYSGILKKFQK